MRLPLLSPGKIIVPCIRAAVIEFDGEFSQKVANTAYVSQLVFYLPERGARRHLTLCLSDIGYHFTPGFLLAYLVLDHRPLQQNKIPHSLGKSSHLPAQYL